jgi:hypothetical protein
MQSIEELAYRQIAANCRGKSMTGAVRYARKTEFSEKHKARSTILSLLTKDRFPGKLTILTMPSLNWEFEARLLALRESGWIFKNKNVKRTFITGVEIDPAVYRGGCLKMPRGDECAFVSIPNSPMWTAHTISSNIVSRFHNCDVFNLMRNCDVQYSVVWLDFTGPLSRQKIEEIQTFYDKRIKSILVVTCLAARYNQETSLELETYGELEGWFTALLPGKVEHCIRYQDGASPMIQYAVRKD